MVSNHWLQGGLDTAWAGTTVFANTDLAIPAGGIIKRFLLRGVRVQGTGTGAAFNRVAPIYAFQTVDLIAGEYGAHNLFMTVRRVPSDYVALYDSTTAERIYTQYIMGGDNELGFNQRCSYGTRGGPGMTIRYQWALFLPPGTLAAPSGTVTWNFRVLYETVP